MQVTNLGPLGPIDVKKFPSVPTPPHGYRWIGDGSVRLVPTEMCRPERKFDPNTLIDDEDNFKKVLINMENDVFDYAYEAGFATEETDSETGEKYYDVKSSRTRLRIFNHLNQGAYPIRLMELLPGHNADTCTWMASFEADISHRPARQLTYKQIAQQLYDLMQRKIAWYEGQTRNFIDNELVYGYDEFAHWYWKVAKVHRKYDADMSMKIWKKVQEGYTTTEKINTKSPSEIKNEFMESKSITHRKDDVKVNVICMDHPQANAPANIFPIMKERNSEKKTVLCLYTKSSKTAGEVLSARKLWRDSIISKVSELAGFFLDGEVPERYLDATKEDKVKSFFDNVEVWSYNHLETEEEMVRIAI